MSGETMDNYTNDEKFISAINEMFSEKIPFNNDHDDLIAVDTGSYFVA